MAEVLPFGSKRAFFSASTPPDLRRILQDALEATTSSPERTEALLLKARRQWPEEPDAHISLYKFYFVARRYHQAEAAVWAALRMAAQDLGITRNYRRLTPHSAQWSQRQGSERLYLFSLKALGVIRLRRDRVVQAQAVLAKLLELDPLDEIGGGTFLQIAQSFTEEDD
ncbi:hypothetical protein LX59_00363 [Azomonas agilis]|uniref:Tetratricopeptide repeat protein n=1 Tax=Azomonas agilis TaxID=116849 RepID=A0A562J2L4_9GAMM|nr:hypothetical protein [Azomonas agilis]TWH77446.1 hypothetical protein LX59_00363 [Azomonas agilis]